MLAHNRCIFIVEEYNLPDIFGYKYIILLLTSLLLYRHLNLNCGIWEMRFIYFLDTLFYYLIYKYCCKSISTHLFNSCFIIVKGLCYPVQAEVYIIWFLPIQANIVYSWAETERIPISKRCNDVRIDSAFRVLLKSRLVDIRFLNMKFGWTKF